MLRVRPVQVLQAPVRAARLASSGQCRESNHGGSVPSMESETLRQRSRIDGLTRRPQHLRTARSSLGLGSSKAAAAYRVHRNIADLTKPARERQPERMVPVRLHGGNRVMMHVTLTIPALAL
jgi:hypothetical protein